MKYLLSALALCLGLTAAAQSLVLLHTNDTHSSIDADPSGTGGVLARKAVIDSIREAEDNTLLIDAGDMVQGTLYFKLFRGKAEYPVNNLMGYDIRILGNHEFDNGLQELADYWKTVKADRLSANYDFSSTPAKNLFKPYVIKKIGKKKVGFIGLNVDPASLIVEENYAGMKYEDPIAVANRIAGELKKKGVDLVVAVTHIGYDEPFDKPDDIKLAQASKDIDIIIGGHSHTLIDPAKPEKYPHWIKNADGRDVLVVQTGKYGKYVGVIKLDLADFGDRKMDYQLIPVSERFAEEKYSNEIKKVLAPFKAAVDSLNNTPVAWSLSEMPIGKTVGAYPNWTADFALNYARMIADSITHHGQPIPSIDLAIMNVGGIRQPMPAGMVSEGLIMATFPFANRLRIIQMKGRDLKETMRIVSAKGGESVSNSVLVLLNPEGKFEKMLLNGREIEPEKTYTLATIDYLAEGNDDMLPMKHHKELWRDSEEVYVRVLEYLKSLTEKGIPVMADPSPRFVKDCRGLITE